MRHTRSFDADITNYGYWTFLRCQIWPFIKSTHVYFTCRSLSLWTMLGLEILAHLYFFSRGFSRVQRCVTLAISVSASQTMLTGPFKNARLGPFSNLHTCMLLVEVCRFGQCLGLRFSPIYIFFCTRVFSHVQQCGNLAFLVWGSQTMLCPPPHLHKGISLVEVYRFGQCLGWRFSPLKTFFSLLSSRAFRDGPHSCFRCGSPNQCLPHFLKMLLLAILEIYTCVFHLCKSIDLDSAQVRDSRPYQPSFCQFSRVQRCATLAVLVSAS